MFILTKKLLPLKNSLTPPPPPECICRCLSKTEEPCVIDSKTDIICMHLDMWKSWSGFFSDIPTDSPTDRLGTFKEKEAS